MRFEKLLLRAFGPFTDVELDLSGGAPGGLHVIYGPNEAGKSTSLRGVKNFLFGMPTRSQDAHLHPSSKLAVGATVSHDGTLYELLRLKRKKDDLLDGEGQAVANNPLPSMLGQLDERSFSLRFGLDQVELEKGAEALLGGSEQGLFAAGTAGADARKLLDALESEASGLFLPRGKNPLLNRQSSEYEEAARELKRAERPPEKWQEQERAYVAAQQQTEALRKERADVRAELRRLTRIQSVISDLSEWQAQRLRAQELSDVVDLPLDAREQRQQAERRLREAEVEARRVGEELSAFEAELSTIAGDSSLADVDDEQLALAARIGTAISARRDLPKRRAALLEVERQIGVLLRDLGHDVASGDELARARAALTGEQTAGAVRRLVAQRSGLESAVREAERRYRDITRQLSQRPEDSSAVQEETIVRLEAALADARAFQSQSAELQRELALSQSESLRLEELRLRTGFCGKWQELAGVLPAPEAVRTAIERYASDERAREMLEGQRGKLRQALQQLERERRGAGEVPSEEMLRDVRGQRDGVVQRLVAGEQDAPRPVELVPLIERADLVADRLRFEASRVAQVQALEQKAEEARQQELELQGQIDSLLQAAEAAESRYQQMMQRLAVDKIPSLKQSEQTVVQLHELCRIAREQETRELLLAQGRERAEQVKSALFSALRATGVQSANDADGLGLSGAVSWADRCLREGLATLKERQLREQREAELLRAQEDTALELDTARKSLQTWHREWGQAVQPLGLDAEASIERAQEVLATLVQIGRALENAGNLEGRIIGMVRDTEELDRDVRKCVASHGLKAAADEDTVELAQRLFDSVRAARRVREERERVTTLIEQRRESLSGIEARLGEAQQTLEQMMRVARAKDLENLVDIENAALEKAAVRARLQELVTRIQEASGGTSPDELLEEAQEYQGAVRRLNVRIDELDDRNAELDEALREAESNAESLRLGLELYKSQDVAILRQVVSERASTARATLREYLLLKAAHSMLKQEVERYAERFSGPIAARAGELFSKITLGKYSGLSIGVGERTLRCVRDGHDIEVSELSRGTRAQLYFVLRVASLEHYFHEHGAVPLVFDDLFVDFDDDRTSVAFELLADLARSTQILYFTHLARDVEKAHDAVPRDLLFSHTIGVS